MIDALDKPEAPKSPPPLRRYTPPTGSRRVNRWPGVRGSPRSRSCAARRPHRFASSRQAVRTRPRHHRESVRAGAARPATSPAAARAALGALARRRPRAPARQPPDRAYYGQATERLGGNRACLAPRAELLDAGLHVFADSATKPSAQPRPVLQQSVRARPGSSHQSAPRARSTSLSLPPHKDQQPPRGPDSRTASPTRSTPLTDHITDRTEVSRPVRPGRPPPPRTTVPRATTPHSRARPSVRHEAGQG